MRIESRHKHACYVLAASALLSGCATFSADGGMTEVSQMTQQRIGQPLERANNTKDAQVESRRNEQVRQLLAQPLTADDAVRIALLNNPALQADLAELGVAEADLVQAGRLRNPGISFGRLERTGGGAEIERGIMFDLAGLLTMPMRTQIERGRFEQARVRAAASAVTLAADVRRAYFSAVATRQTAQFMARAQQAAEAGAELAQRMQQVGNWNRLDTAREQMFYADATATLARSQHEERVTRERLTRLLGLWQGDVTLSLPDTLPALPSTLRDAIDLEKLALENRLDIQLAKQATASTAQALGLNKTTRFINVLDLGYRNKSETGSPRRDGYEVSLELPLFDWGTARVAKAEALYMQSLNRTADTAIHARSQVRESYSAYRTNYDLSRHYRDEVVPLRKKISEEMQLRYNGMFVSVFDLLADARRQIDAVNAAINAQRDFWLAETALQAAINGAGSPTDVLNNANRAVATNATNNEH